MGNGEGLGLGDGEGDGEGDGDGFGDGFGDGDGLGDGDGEGLGVAVGVGVGFGEPWLTEPQPASASTYANASNTLRYRATFLVGFMNNLFGREQKIELALEMSSSSSELALGGA